MFLRFTLFMMAASAVLGEDYGLDCSFPIHNMELSCGDLLGDRKAFYDNFMDGCRQYYGAKGTRCDLTERERLIMSKRQPQSMVCNDLSF